MSDKNEILVQAVHIQDLNITSPDTQRETKKYPANVYQNMPLFP